MIVATVAVAKGHARTIKSKGDGKGKEECGDKEEG